MVSIIFTNQEELKLLIVARFTLSGQLNRSIVFFGEDITFT